VVQNELAEAAQIGSAAAAATEEAKWSNTLAEGLSERVQLEYFAQCDTSVRGHSRVQQVPYASCQHDGP